MARKPDPQYKYDKNNMPTLAEPWNGLFVPELPELQDTGSDRRARGELELIVEHVVKDWFVNHMKDWTPTAENISRQVTRIDSKSCSSGAVWGILDRWERIGFAKSEIKPKRFSHFLPGAFSMGLPELYRREKRKRVNEKKFGRFGGTDGEYIPIVEPNFPPIQRSIQAED